MGKPILEKGTLSENDNLNLILRAGVYALNKLGNKDKGYPYNGILYGTLLVYRSLDLVTQILITSSQQSWVRTGVVETYKTRPELIVWKVI